MLARQIERLRHCQRADEIVIATTANATDDPVAALAAAGRLLGVAPGTRGLPMSEVPLEIAADVVGLDDGDPGRTTEVVGQVAIATTPGRVAAVRLRPTTARDHEPVACAAAVDAIRTADWVVFGPGSWFTSVLPHLLVPGLRDALGATTARRVVVLNLEPQVGETAGFSPSTHLEVFAVHATGMPVDVVIADRRTAADDEELEAAAASLGARLVVADVASPDGAPRHDSQRLAAVYADVFDGAGSAGSRKE
jgi:uncharacterized cofD-like protein